MQASIGGEPVVASGFLLLGNGKHEANVQFDGLEYVFFFRALPTPITASVSLSNDQKLHFSIMGTPPLGGAAWSFDGVGIWQGKLVDVTFRIGAYTGILTRPATWELGYTFTVSNRDAPPQPVGILGHLP